MSSPFPGMDPYLEGEMWQEFHERLASEISAQLMPKLAPKYVALLAKRYVLNRPVFGIFGEIEQRVFYPDVHVVYPPRRIAETAIAADVAIAEPATEVISLLPDDVPIMSVELRDVADRRLVTVIEILSPANKIGEGVKEYLARRDAFIHTQTHLMEIDLLRLGKRIALDGEIPEAPYYVYLSRVQRRPYTQIWPVSLRQRLPVMPLPLLPPDPDVPLDLQAAVDACFALVGYERLLDYAAPLPYLSDDDAAWVAERLRARGGTNKIE